MANIFFITTLIVFMIIISLWILSIVGSNMVKNESFDIKLYHDLVDALFALSIVSTIVIPIISNIGLLVYALYKHDMEYAGSAGIMLIVFSMITIGVFSNVNEDAIK